MLLVLQQTPSFFNYLRNILDRIIKPLLHIITPKPQDSPALTPQLGIDHYVPRYISFNLLDPEVNIRLWPFLNIAPIFPMKEVAVNKNCNLVFFKR